MNDRQFEEKKRELREEMRAIGCGWINGDYVKPPKEYQLRDRELSCISMINSILAYQGRGMTNAEDVLQMEERSYHNYLADYVELFGRDKVIALIQEQIDSIYRVDTCVYTDGEGVSYNSIIWKEI